ncbi:cAMP-responsive element-binding protein-like 2 isoform X1 [Perognathus longimembris pacificus]|uniref:cAMP-responsive element-binding protein-like 2 isoform X1 n=1 Tax=Perognathus longimembris pacificus TaxID=214514 RepID=UPI002018ABD2|nr:cAMP-responsive element-binding protein-like 2 isoform X1 [Perognathus longimembris pacificus]
MDDSKVVGGKVKKPGKRGRKPAKIDLKAKLERSRQSARECRARKKLRYQYLEELVSSRERAICALREELDMYKQWCVAMDQGKIPSEIKALLTAEEQSKSQQSTSRLGKTGKADAASNSYGDNFKERKLGNATHLLPKAPDCFAMRLKDGRLPARSPM